MQTLFIPARGFVQLLNVNSLFGNTEPIGAVRLEPDQHIEAFVSVIQNTRNIPSFVPWLREALGSPSPQFPTWAVAVDPHLGDVFVGKEF